MDINAKFTADFTEFNTGVGAAEEKLKGIEGESTKVAEAISTIPPALEATNTAAAGAAGSTNTFAQALQSADKTLSLAGVNISKEVGAIKELGLAADKTAAQIGLVGTAGLVVGAGLTGWNIGRAIANFFDLDKAIADTTAAVLGWGNVSEQVALSQVAELTKATNLLNREVTDLSEARRINAKAVEAEQMAATKAKEAHDAYLRSVQALNALDLDWHVTLQTLTQDQEDWIRELLRLGGTVQDIARAEHFHENQVKAVALAMADEKKAAEEYAAAVKKIQEFETGQTAGRIAGLHQLGTVEQVESDARIARILKEAKAFEDAMDREAAAAKKFNAERESAGAVQDPIMAAAMERDAAMGRANQRWPGGGPDLNAIYQAVQTKFQDAIDNIGRGTPSPGFNMGQVPFSQLAPTVNVNVALDGRQLTSAISTQIMQNTGRQFPSR